MSFFLKRSFAAVLAVFAVLSHPPAVHGQALTITTFAGPQAGTGFEDGTGSAARFNAPAIDHAAGAAMKIPSKPRDFRSRGTDNGRACSHFFTVTVDDRMGPERK